MCLTVSALDDMIVFLLSYFYLQANQLYPFAISLIESMRTYERTCEKVEEKPDIQLLVAGMRKEVQGLVGEVGLEVHVVLEYSNSQISLNLRHFLLTSCNVLHRFGMFKEDFHKVQA